MLQLTAEQVAEIETAAEELDRTRPGAAALIRRLVRAATEPQPGYVSTTEAARILGVSSQTVRNWVDRGWLPGSRAHRLGRRQIPRAALEGVMRFDAARERKVRVELDADAVDTLVRSQREEGSRAKVGGRS